MGLLLLLSDSGFRGALDALGTGLESAWSAARRLRSAYNRLDPIIRVRRSSDNSESDFAGLGTKGEVDLAAVAAFCGAGDGQLTKIYDQSGNGRDFAQSSTTIQPIVCESGTALTEGGRLAPKYVAVTAHKMEVASSTSFYPFLHTTGGSVFVVSKASDTAAVKAILVTNNGGTANDGFLLTRDASERVLWQSTRLTGPASGSSVFDTSTNGSTSHSILAITVDPDNATAANRLFGWENGTALTGFVNAQTGTPNSVASSTFNLRMGDYNTLSSPFDGSIQEVVIFSNVVSTADRQALQTNQGSFYGITVA